MGFQNRPEVNGIANDPDADHTVFIDDEAGIQNAVDRVINMACA